MMLDKNLQLSAAQAPTTQATHRTTNQVYLGDVSNGMGTYSKDEDLWMIFEVKTTLTSGGSATVNFLARTDTDTAFGSPVTLASLGATGYATLVAGYIYQVNIKGMPVEDYLEGAIVIAAADLTAGAFDVYLSPTPVVSNVN